MIGIDATAPGSAAAPAGSAIATAEDHERVASAASPRAPGTPRSHGIFGIGIATGDRAASGPDRTPGGYARPIRAGCPTSGDLPLDSRGARNWTERARTGLRCLLFRSSPSQIKNAVELSRVSAPGEGEAAGEEAPISGVQPVAAWEMTSKFREEKVRSPETDKLSGLPITPAAVRAAKNGHSTTAKEEWSTDPYGRTMLHAPLEGIHLPRPNT
ncbi:hypothetical protein THAOC_33707 [Thalassiosira oceanica]|uniref:Uncharacterized protein n=1 Tax=Thalassiosira oceanica TaxID=159749 RepID=K0R3Q3_THAOC|nr:hypothetical protein THAOC_33707 [Thalassiosira oceanica]|eukprot:EJK47563.1 hypothetical protein THAOC_33707 [Thalassiosira oceanica]